MFTIVTPRTIKFLIVLNVLSCIVTVWPYVILDTSFFRPEFYSFLYYLGAFCYSVFLLFTIAVLKKYKQKKWIQNAFWAFIGWQIYTLFLNPYLFKIFSFDSKLVFIIAVIALVFFVCFIVAIFKIAIDDLSSTFKQLGYALIVASLIRMGAPVLSLIFEDQRMMRYNELTYLLPSLVNFLLLYKLFDKIAEEKEISMIKSE